MHRGAGDAVGDCVGPCDGDGIGVNEGDDETAGDVEGTDVNDAEALACAVTLGHVIPNTTVATSNQTL